MRLAACLLTALLCVSYATAVEPTTHRPLAVVYVGGFFFAILLRLIMVPLLYEVLSKLGRTPATCEVPE